jgi:hypothetical protein
LQVKVDESPNKHFLFPSSHEKDVHSNSFPPETSRNSPVSARPKLR